MKRAWFGFRLPARLALIAFLGLILPVYALDISIRLGTPPPPPPPMRPRPPSPTVIIEPEPVYVDFYTDAELHMCSAYFGLDYPIVYAYYTDYGLTPDEVVYVLYLSHYCHRSPRYVIEVYKRHPGHEWYAISRELRMPYGTPSWLRDSRAPTLAVLHVTSDYYGVPYSRVYAYHKRGYKPGEIVAAVNVSGRTGRSVNEVLVERNKGKKWEDIARDNKISFDEIKAPRERGKSVKFGAPLDEKGDKDSKDNGHGKDRDRGKDDTKGKDKGHDKGND